MPKLEAVNGLLPVAVREEDVGGFSAQFQGGRDETAGCGQGYLAAYLGRQPVNASLRKPSLVEQYYWPDLEPGTGNHVEYALGNDILY